MSVKARLYMLDQHTEEQFRVGCATPGLHCQEFPLFAPTIDEARVMAAMHAEQCRHVSSIKWVRTTSIEVWSADEQAAIRAASQTSTSVDAVPDPSLSAPTAPTRAAKIAAAVVPEQLDTYLPEATE